MERWTIGTVAKRTGLTVRTLHHWDAVGLVSPAGRSESGYRIYGRAELERIEKAMTLRQLGFGLEQTARILDDPGWTRVRVLRARLDALDREMAEQARVRERLAKIVEAAEQGGSVEGGDVLELVREMDAVRAHYTPDQLETMSRRRAEVGEEELRRVERRWPELIAEVAEHVRRRTPPDDPRVVELATEWRGLIEAFTGGDAAVEANLGAMYAARPELARAMGITPEMTALIDGALTRG